MVDDYKLKYDKVSEDLINLRKSNEEEIKLRISFETKVNGLHALHRDLQSKYTRSLQEIHEIETQLKQTNQLYIAQ